MSRSSERKSEVLVEQTIYFGGGDKRTSSRESGTQYDENTRTLTVGTSGMWERKSTQRTSSTSMMGHMRKSCFGIDFKEGTS